MRPKPGVMAKGRALTSGTATWLRNVSMSRRTSGSAFCVASDHQHAAWKIDRGAEESAADCRGPSRPVWCWLMTLSAPH